MIRRLVPLVCVLGLGALEACGGKVVLVEANPMEGAAIMVDGSERRQNRWTLDPGEHQIDVLWPDGTQITERFQVRRDIKLTVHKEGRKGAVEGFDQPQEEETPAVAVGEGGEDQPPRELTPEESFAEAKRLFKAGKKAFELAEFESAIESFKGAYELLRDAESSEYDSIRIQVAYNLAVVYERSYDVTPKVERLRKARVMFQNYDKDMSRTDPAWAGSKDQTELRTHIDEIEARVEKIESGGN